MSGVIAFFVGLVIGTLFGMIISAFMNANHFDDKNP